MKKLVSAVLCAATMVAALAVPAEAAPNPASNLPHGFDLQAHRGGMAEYTESSLAAYAHTLKVGVTTLEMDIYLSKDGKPMIWHDLVIKPQKCRDTAPAFPHDPAYPYVGKTIASLTFQQLRTVRCDKFQRHYKDTLHRVPNATIYTLDELFDMVRKTATYPVHFNIETKTVPVKDSDDKAYRTMKSIVDTSRKHGFLNRIMLQSFDWRTLEMVRKYSPSVPTVMLYSRAHWVPFTPMSGPVDYLRVGGDIIKAAQQLGAQVLSPDYGSEHNLYADATLCARAHAAGLKVVPYTVDSEEAMRNLITAGVDGFITNYPTRGKQIAHSMQKM